LAGHKHTPFFQLEPGGHAVHFWVAVAEESKEKMRCFPYEQTHALEPAGEELPEGQLEQVMVSMYDNDITSDGGRGDADGYLFAAQHDKEPTGAEGPIVVALQVKQPAPRRYARVLQYELTGQEQNVLPATDVLPEGQARQPRVVEKVDGAVPQ
jgi:hypothetical protein